MADHYSDASGDFLAFLDDLKRKNTVTFTVGDRTFHLRGPAIFSDDELARMEDTSVSQVDKARLMIDDYDGFVECGGSAMSLNAYYAKVFGDEAQAEGEGAASSAS